MSELSCNVRLCNANESSECTCETGEFKTNDLACPSFHLTLKPIECQDIEEKDTVLEVINAFNMLFVVLDENSLSFNMISLPDGQAILVQGTIDKVNNFRFYKCVDGTVDCVSKNQTELAL